MKGLLLAAVNNYPYSQLLQVNRIVNPFNIITLHNIYYRVYHLTIQHTAMSVYVQQVIIIL